MKNIHFYLSILVLVLLVFSCGKENAGVTILHTQYYADKTDQDYDIDQDGDADIRFKMPYGVNTNTQGVSYGLDVEFLNTDWYLLTHDLPDYFYYDTTYYDHFQFGPSEFYHRTSVTSDDFYSGVEIDYVAHLYSEEALDFIGIWSYTQEDANIFRILIGDQRYGLSTGDLPFPGTVINRLSYIGNYKFDNNDGFIVFTKNPLDRLPVYYAVRIAVLDKKIEAVTSSIGTGLKFYKARRTN